MTLRKMIEFIQQHHPNMGEKEIIEYLNEGLDDFSSDTRIVEGYSDFITSIDKRYYPISDDILEIKEVNYDASTTITALMSDADSAGAAGADYTFTLVAGHGLTASNIGDNVALSNFTELTALNGLTTQLKTLSTDDITLEGVISTGTQETSSTAVFTFHSSSLSKGKRIPRLIGIPDERDIS